ATPVALPIFSRSSAVGFSFTSKICLDEASMHRQHTFHYEPCESRSREPSHSVDGDAYASMNFRFSPSAEFETRPVRNDDRSSEHR
ncbi:MAG: hypothetical protein WA869_33880, partial [Alloacidobacterium sp.]